MKMIDIVLNDIKERFEHNVPYFYRLGCVVNSALDIPDHVRAKYEQQIVFELRDDLDEYVDYDFKSRTLIVNMRFSGVPYTVAIPVDNVKAISDELNNEIITFSPITEEREQPKPKKPHLRVVSSDDG